MRAVRHTTKVNKIRQTKVPKRRQPDGGAHAGVVMSSSCRRHVVVMFVYLAFDMTKKKTASEGRSKRFFVMFVMFV